jgi:hypothetical protein
MFHAFSFIITFIQNEVLLQPYGANSLYPYYQLQDAVRHPDAIRVCGQYSAADINNFYFNKMIAHLLVKNILAFKFLKKYHIYYANLLNTLVQCIRGLGDI